MIPGDGELNKQLTIKVDRVSASAKEKIEKAKGTVIELMKTAPEKEASKKPKQESEAEDKK